MPTSQILSLVQSCAQFECSCALFQTVMDPDSLAIVGVGVKLWKRELSFGQERILDIAFTLIAYYRNIKFAITGAILNKQTGCCSSANVQWFTAELPTFSCLVSKIAVKKVSQAGSQPWQHG